ncbi:serine/threonine-protein phosphatase 6 regulatory ankyrin repeat subunit A-like [Coffea eugenioides]|uniref:serine/threonine-protein phosphatase 6 regulatory ankyrin repeat subunit A-like n=1 Tax=Coffea eugenioides TaxID=49369 RepID=UPI000F613DB6|nr:serine/threonine-protein phosphatase 6 regulatory ankyrin repeat subunit A-like [Coffea eugenioides]
MDRRLCDAALEGDVTALCQLLQEDPLALAKAALKCEDKNPLHIAAILGHVDFVKAILQVDFAYIMCLARDQDGRNPLHLAAVYGRLEVLQELLYAGSQVNSAHSMCLARDRDGRNPLHLAAMYDRLEVLQALLDAGSQANSAHPMCLARDRDGRNPLHLAAMYGRVAVLQVLIRVGFQAALEKTDGGGTILHLCIIYNQLEALKMLVDILKHPEFENTKNEDGMTILHLAMYYKQHETVKYILQKSGVDNVKSELARLGHTTGAKTSNFSTGLQHLITESRSWIQVACSIIATMAFQAAMSPPGGVWQDDLTVDSHGTPVPNPHRAGEAIMAYTHPRRYELFVFTSQISFWAALSTIIITICDFTGSLARLLLSLLLYIAIVTLTTTHYISIISVYPKCLTQKRSQRTALAGLVLLYGSVCLLGGMLVIAVVWRKLKRKDPVQLNHLGEPRDSAAAHV